MKFDGDSPWWDELAKLFDPADIEWRIQRSFVNDRGPGATVLAYVTNRAIQDRLDQVVGPENWKNEFVPGVSGGVLCGLSIRVNNEWITKWDGAENTSIEAVKGGISGAMKRAAVQWGIGRYLYKLDEMFAVIFSENDKTGQYRAKAKGRNGTEVKFRWNPPRLPEWALPIGASESHGQGQSTDHDDDHDTASKPAQTPNVDSGSTIDAAMLIHRLDVAKQEGRIAESVHKTWVERLEGVGDDKVRLTPMKEAIDRLLIVDDEKPEDIF